MKHMKHMKHMSYTPEKEGEHMKLFKVLLSPVFVVDTFERQTLLS